MMAPQRFRCRFEAGEDFGALTLPFDPRTVFGKARAPVIVTINGHSFRSTVAHMGGPPFIPFRKSNRDAAGVSAGVDFEVELALDEAMRTVDVPDDLAVALAALSGGQDAWDALSFTAKREQIDAITDAKKPETRLRRLEKTAEMLKARIDR